MPYEDSVRAFLSSASDAKLEAVRLRDKVRRLEAQATRVTTAMSTEPKGGGADRNELLASLCDMQLQYERKLLEAEKQEEKVVEFIEMINNPVERAILRLRYVEAKEWNDVNKSLRRVGLFYSERQIYRLHGTALQSAREIFKEIHDDEKGIVS